MMMIIRYSFQFATHFYYALYKITNGLLQLRPDQAFNERVINIEKIINK